MQKEHRDDPKRKVTKSMLRRQGQHLRGNTEIGRIKIELPSTIDGYDRPADRFADVYENLYNSADDKRDIEEINKEVETAIDEHSIVEVNRVTPTNFVW